MGFFNKLNDNDKRMVSLEHENEKLKSEIKRLGELLEAELKAKENNCHRGDYCRVCKHAVVIWDKCYCTFGQCDNFEKEFHFCGI